MPEFTIQPESRPLRRPVLSPTMVPSFDIDARLTVRLKFNLAMELSDLILESETPNKALQAFALQLRNLEDQEG